MTIIALTSARQSPGVTTTAVGLALVWPHPTLIIEADTAGGSSILAGYLRGTQPHRKGMVDLAIGVEQALTIDHMIDTWAIPIPDTGVRVVPGLQNTAQAVTANAVWPEIAGALHRIERTGTDIIIDAGRISAHHYPAPLVQAADVCLITTRTSLPALNGLRAALPLLINRLEQGAFTGTLGLLVIGNGQPYDAREIAKTIGTHVIDTLPWDPANAEVFSVGAAPSRKLDHSPLVRAYRTLAQQLAAAGEPQPRAHI